MAGKARKGKLADVGAAVTAKPKVPVTWSVVTLLRRARRAAAWHQQREGWLQCSSTGTAMKSSTSGGDSSGRCASACYWLKSCACPHSS